MISLQNNLRQPTLYSAVGSTYERQLHVSHYPGHIKLLPWSLVEKSQVNRCGNKNLYVKYHKWNKQAAKTKLLGWVMTSALGDQESFSLLLTSWLNSCSRFLKLELDTAQMPLASVLIYTVQSPSIKLLAHGHKSLPSTPYFCDLPCILTPWIRPRSDHLAQGPVDQYVELPNSTWDWIQTLYMFLRQWLWPTIRKTWPWNHFLNWLWVFSPLS